MVDFTSEIEKRRTFAIISHPDAGKTTLTEKILLFGGAIRVAGAVKSNKIKISAKSDFMEIEKQRGISVATSVMGFEYRGKKINILDTPGHQDFAEDTYRTLTAVDSVILVIDVVKGVESQTEKLLEVCRMRKTPVIVYINKLDREGKDCLELLDEIEDKLNIHINPLTWPIGMGRDFKGVYSIYEENVKLFKAHEGVNQENIIKIASLDKNSLSEYIPEYLACELIENIKLVQGVYPKFDKQEYLNGNICPVFFGSAINNFGVQEMLNCFVDIAPHPRDSKTDKREVSPFEDKFSGFVFKIHANIDPNHRSRIAFLKVASGIFERNKDYYHTRLKRDFRFSSPVSFMADKKDITEISFPGDIVGLPDSGNFKIGDTLTQGEMLNFVGIPSFAPENFRYIENADPMKAKQLAKGLDELMGEGLAQLFINNYNGRKIIGTLGPLQFDVIQFRLKHEYQASCRYEPLNIFKACWVSCENKKELDDFLNKKKQFIATDKHKRVVFLAESQWAIKMICEDYPSLTIHYTSEL